jgi:hypothetical protein
MSIFQLYLRLGIEHIADIQGYDHILFLIALCIVYPVKSWKKLVILITAFTIGHSLTLALASLEIITVPGKLIEFLIPATIALTALANLFVKSEKVHQSSHLIKYFAALFFGLIHGLGFSNYLNSLLGQEESIVLPLFAFNLGIELGQLAILGVIILLTLLFVDLIGVKRREWNVGFSGAALGVSVVLMLERWGF